MDESLDGERVRVYEAILSCPFFSHFDVKEAFFFFFLARLIFWNKCSFLLPMPRSADTQVIFTNTQIAPCSTLS